MRILANQEPVLLWKHFEALSEIPRVSGNEAAAGDYVISVAKKLGLSWRKDKAGNIVVEKAASPGREKAPTVIMQSHLDMVGQKRGTSTHDFAKDPIQLIVEDGWLHAKDTTLGADNGIGVAASLAALEDTALQHGPLKALFTVEEEIGLKGAGKVDPSFLAGDILINIDGDSPHELTIGCAGAADVVVSIPLSPEKPSAEDDALKIEISGFSGGHSGAEIHKGRGNAMKLLARLLGEAGKITGCRLVSFQGGSARNAIPREATATVLVPRDHAPAFTAKLEEHFVFVRSEHRSCDPKAALRIEKVGTAVSSCASVESTARFIAFLRIAPSGVARNSDTHAGVVETSGNLAIVQADASMGRIQFLLRSLIDSGKRDLAASIVALAGLAGGSAVIESDYPGWAPDKDSKATAVFAEIAEKVLGQKPHIAVIHAGLECGILRAANPKLDCISCGARIESMHAPDERVELNSVNQVYTIVRNALVRFSAA